MKSIKKGVRKKSPTLLDEFVTDPYALIAKLSFSHIVELRE